MSALTKTIKEAYKAWILINDYTNGIDSSLERITDGSGNNSSLRLSKNAFEVQPQDSDTTTAFNVKAKSGTALLTVDSTNSSVKALSRFVNTQYAYFGANNIDTADFTDDTHMVIPFNSQGYGDLGEIPAFGTGTDPALTFTTAEGNATRASDIVPVMWRVPDNLTIDEIKHIEGADTATGDTTRMHLVSYTFTSGATACLTSGAVVANTSADNTNAGSEQPYLKDWTIGTSDIDAGTVLLCMFRSDSVNSDYSINVTIKYHLR